MGWFNPYFDFPGTEGLHCQIPGTAAQSYQAESEWHQKPEQLVLTKYHRTHNKQIVSWRFKKSWTRPRSFFTRLLNRSSSEERRLTTWLQRVTVWARRVKCSTVSLLIPSLFVGLLIIRFSTGKEAEFLLYSYVDDSLLAWLGVDCFSIFRLLIAANSHRCDFPKSFSQLPIVWGWTKLVNCSLLVYWGCVIWRCHGSWCKQSTGSSQIQVILAVPSSRLCHLGMACCGYLQDLFFQASD